MPVSQLVDFMNQFIWIGSFFYKYISIKIFAQPIVIPALIIFCERYKGIEIKMRLFRYIFYYSGYFIINCVANDEVLSNHIDAVKIFFSELFRYYERVGIFQCGFGITCKEWQRKYFKKC